jgi:type III secretion HrpO family protein
MDSFITQIVEEALVLVLLLSAPPVLAAAGAGMLTSLMQATTQVQDASLSFVPKLVAVGLSLVIAAPWIGEHLLRFATTLLSALPEVAQ